MTIESNISTVIGQMSALKAGVPIAAERALRHDRWPWLEEARIVARRVIAARVRNAAEREAIDPFVRAIAADFIDEVGGLKLSLSPRTASTFSPIERAAQDLERGEVPDRNTLEEIFSLWVDTPASEGGKRVKPETLSRPRNADEDAKFMAWLIYGPPEKRTAGARSGLGERFLGHLREWLVSSHRPLGEEVIADWLLSVLGAWHQMVQKNFRGPFKIELNQIMKESR